MAFDIVQYGAGSGETLCTGSIQAAIDDCARAGGGFVHVPAGRFVTGTIELKSHVFLDLAPGAELLGSWESSDFRGPARRSPWDERVIHESLTHCRALVFAERAVDTGVVGHGTIDVRRGSGYPGMPQGECRPYLMVFSECTDVAIRDVTLRNPAFFTFYAMSCKRVHVSGVRIHTLGSANGDGLDFEGGEDVILSDCLIEAGDDCISLKSLYPGNPCRNFTITNCIFKSVWAGVRLGPESTSGVSGITVSNCRFIDCHSGIKIQPSEGVVFEDLTFSNMNMQNVRQPLFLSSARYRLSGECRRVRPDPSILRRVLVDNLVATMPETSTGFGMCFNAIVGLPNACIEDVTLRGLQIESHGGGTREMANRAVVPELLDFTELYCETIHFMGELPASGLYARNVKGLKVVDSRFVCANHDERPAIHAENVSALEVRGVAARNTSGCIRTAGCEGAVIRECTKDGAAVRSAIHWPPPLEQARKAAYETALEVDREMETWASAVDMAESGTLIQCMEADNANRDRIVDRDVEIDEGNRVFLLIRRLCGPLTVFVNGRPAGRFLPVRPYWYLAAWALDITDTLAAGSRNHVRIRLDAPGEFGALMALPQFSGDFSGVENGVYSPVEIRAVKAHAERHGMPCT